MNLGLSIQPASRSRARVCVVHEYHVVDSCAMLCPGSEGIREMKRMICLSKPRSLQSNVVYSTSQDGGPTPT